MVKSAIKKICYSEFCLSHCKERTLCLIPKLGDQIFFSIFRSNPMSCQIPLNSLVKNSEKFYWLILCLLSYK